MGHFTRAATIAAAAGAMLLAPLVASAQTPHKSKPPCTTTKPGSRHLTSPAPAAVFTFGIQGGNIVPWTVTFAGDGAVTATGWVKPKNARLAEPSNELNALITLANADGFFSMPGMTNCSGTLPDIASRYVTINTGAVTKTVRVHGACVPAFNEIFAALENTADFQH
jgi:hypothetical protein